ncbi:MAG: RluA family pseudouridine synthase, partial [Pseudonocardiaceae bacterium]
LYPVHRIDKATSGIILFTKELAHHGDLTRQFNKRTVDKSYLAITRSTGLPSNGVIGLPLSVGRKSRVRVAAPRESISCDPTTNHWSVAPSEVLTNTKTYPSVTTFTKIWDSDRHTLLLVQPVTGRRHQIRVHLAWIGHPIDGDPLFDKSNPMPGGRTCLHSWQLAFDACWLDGKRIEIEAHPGEDFWTAVRDSLPDQHIPQLLQYARNAATSRKQDP